MSVELELDREKKRLPQEQAEEVRARIENDLQECAERSHFWLQAEVDDTTIEDIITAVTSADEYDNDLLEPSGDCLAPG